MRGRKVEKPELVLTEDGSHTLRHQSLKELYHSHYGAIQESQHVFIQEGLNHLNLEKVKILEVGFGSGLNALLTALEANERKQIDYLGLDKYPIKEEFWKKLNYPKLIEDERAKSTFQKICEAEWDEPGSINPNFILEKREVDFFKYRAHRLNDVIYFDAFAPTIQPDLWEPEILNEMFKSLRRGGILVTYCSKGSFQRNLKACGFRLEKIPGPPGKREMIRAYRP